MLVNRAIILKQSYVVKQEKNAIIITANSQRPFSNLVIYAEEFEVKKQRQIGFFCIMKVMGGQQLKTLFSSKAIMNFL